MIPEECVEETSGKFVTVEGLRRKATFVNPDRSLFRKILVDDCVIKHGVRADWAVEKVDVGAAIIEFKGRDIEHAADQVAATARYWRVELGYQFPLVGLIVGTQYPKASAAIQRKQAAFAKVFKSPLHVINKEACVTMEDLLRFR